MAADDDEFDDADEVDGSDQDGSEPEVTIEVSGLSLYTHVGVTAAEREEEEQAREHFDRTGHWPGEGPPDSRNGAA